MLHPWACGTSRQSSHSLDLLHLRMVHLASLDSNRFIGSKTRTILFLVGSYDWIKPESFVSQYYYDATNLLKCFVSEYYFMMTNGLGKY